MSGAKDTGGPAFPAVIPLVHSERQGKDYPDYSEAGMTLRDYFAAKAMQGLMSGRWKNDMHGQQFDAYRADANEWARSAYYFADAMLKARNQ